MNYENYTNTELMDVQNSMDPLFHPENYKALMGEIEKRGDSFTEAEIEQEEAFHISLRMKTKIVGGVQIITAVLALWGAISFFNIGNSFLGLVCLGICGFNTIAGVLCILQNKIGFALGIINQSLQLFSFGVGSQLLTYSGGFGFYIFLTSVGEVGFKMPTLNIFEYDFHNLVTPSFLGIDILAIGCIAILLLGMRNCD